jgi:hypothetical protein
MVGFLASDQDSDRTTRPGLVIEDLPHAAASIRYLLRSDIGPEWRRLAEETRGF